MRYVRKSAAIAVNSPLSAARSRGRPGPEIPAEERAGARCAHSLASVEIRGQVNGPGGSGASPATAPAASPSAAPSAALSPYHVRFSIAHITHRDCLVPTGRYGAAKLAKYRVFDSSGRPASGVTIGERFTKLEDPYSVFSRLRPNSYTTGRDGAFDDCYRIFTPRALPSDFRLKVEQNHTIGGRVASKQHITFTSHFVFICVFPRTGSGFGSRCRRY